MVGAAIRDFLLFPAVIVGSVFAFGLLEAFVILCSSHSSSPCGYSSGLTQFAPESNTPSPGGSQFAGAVGQLGTSKTTVLSL